MDLYIWLAGVSTPLPQAEGGQAMPCGDAAVQTQECTHVSEQLLAVEEGAPAARCTYIPGCSVNAA